MILKRTPVNNQIRTPEVRLIDETGKQLGVVGLREALQLAQERHLDLIQVTEKVAPPVCRLGDYGKYLYWQEKKQKEVKKQRGGQVKGIRLSFAISPHDLEIRAKQAEKFLNEGNKVFVEMVLRGREKALSHLAREKVNQFMKILNQNVAIRQETDFKKGPRGFNLIITKQ
ncbi:MAG: translation initiation factor IF-3 [Candidatus Nealsonbacteria bacterium]|nr:translation initiation factor IF-3 [Candidatus Nealsonbacteria bacterium]